MEEAREKIYNRTRRFNPNYVVCAPDVVKYFKFSDAWSPAATKDHNGPYFAGTYDSLKVFVSYSIPQGGFIVGVNNDSLSASAAVYSPYMPIVPTAALQGPDGGTSQGFSTVYALTVVNPLLVVAGKVEPADYDKYVGGVVASQKTNG